MSDKAFPRSLAYSTDVYILVLFILSSKGIDSLLCYSCTDILVKEDCMNVTECSPGELCFGRADGLLNGVVKHTLGCTSDLQSPKAQPPDGFTFCSKQCSKPFCNLDQCNTPDNTSRPIRCLSCDLVRSPEGCKVLTECKQNQHCEPHNNASKLVGKRSAERSPSSNCSMCCNKHHCNAYACSALSQDIGTVYSIRKLNLDTACVDREPSTCSAFGYLNKDSCSLQQVATVCPKSCTTCDTFGWTNWRAWSPCSVSCEQGTRTRERVCLHQLNITINASCNGPSSEKNTCMLRHNCPVNGRWCTTSQSVCDQMIYVYEGNQICISSHTETVQTTCNCPAPAFGGNGC